MYNSGLAGWLQPPSAQQRLSSDGIFRFFFDFSGPKKLKFLLVSISYRDTVRLVDEVGGCY